jgi:2-oxoglutarate/2-oxoacid ferredoxin oxidoreductase subunit beta
MAHQAVARLSVKDFKSDLKPVWCPGCGDFGVVAAVYQALAKLGLDPDQTVLVSGIGCSSRLPGYVNTYSFNTIHGRALPVATGVKMANPALTVIVAGGDGDGFAIGTSHFVHTARRNVDLTYVMMDNGIYGLTKGQVSPTSPHDLVTKTSAYGNVEAPMNPVLMALSCGATFIARAFSGDPKGSQEILAAAIQHAGFSFVHMVSPCVTYRGREQFDVVREHLRALPEGHDPSDRNHARNVAFEDSERVITLGIIYQTDRPTLEDGHERARRKAMARGPFTYDDLLQDFIPGHDAAPAGR